MCESLMMWWSAYRRRRWSSVQREEIAVGDEGAEVVAGEGVGEDAEDEAGEEVAEVGALNLLLDHLHHHIRCLGL